MRASHEPLISKSTGSKVAVASMIAVLTAMLGWLVSTTLETRQNYGVMRDELAWVVTNQRDYSQNMDTTNQRIDILMELITQEILVDEYRRSRESIDAVNENLEQRQ